MLGHATVEIDLHHENEIEGKPQDRMLCRSTLTFFASPFEVTQQQVGGRTRKLSSAVLLIKLRTVLALKCRLKVFLCDYLKINKRLYLRKNAALRLKHCVCSESKETLVKLIN